MFYSTVPNLSDSDNILFQLQKDAVIFVEDNFFYLFLNCLFTFSFILGGEGPDDSIILKCGRERQSINSLRITGSNLDIFSSSVSYIMEFCRIFYK